MILPESRTAGPGFRIIFPSIPKTRHEGLKTFPAGRMAQIQEKPAFPSGRMEEEQGPVIFPAGPRVRPGSSVIEEPG